MYIQYIPRNMHTVFALLCFVMVIHWLIFPYPPGLLHWHCGNLTIAPVPPKQLWWIWINTSCEFIMNDCITTTKQSTTKPCAYFLGYTVHAVDSRQDDVYISQCWIHKCLRDHFIICEVACSPTSGIIHWQQAPVRLTIFRSNSKFDQNWERSSFKYTWPITTKFCTRHDSDTVVTCAKFRCGL